MKIIGYMEGTNSELLTDLLLEGLDTLPLSNGWDNHGKYIAHINRADNISMVVGYLHKFLTISKDFGKSDDILSALKAYRIPTVFIVPKNRQDKAIKLLKGKGVNYKLADPAELTKIITGTLAKRKAAAGKTIKKR